MCREKVYLFPLHTSTLALRLVLIEGTGMAKQCGSMEFQDVVALQANLNIEIKYRRYVHAI